MRDDKKKEAENIKEDEAINKFADRIKGRVVSVESIE
jgi:hypothetical protein